MAKRRRTVVLVHAPGVAMGHARRRAEVMAASLGGEVLVARLGWRRQGGLSGLFGQLLDRGGLERALHQVGVLTRWAAVRRRAGAQSVSAIPIDGDGHLLQICRAADVDLVVVPSRLAQLATWLARRASAPVLLAHSACHRAALLAATDLTRPERPVLRQAGDLAERLRTDLTVVHNLPGFGAQLMAAGLGATVAVIPDDTGVADEQERLLRQEVTELGLPADVTVTQRLDTASGILEAAAERNVDLIVVGAPRPHLFGHRVCERICDLADRSVLMVPV